MSILPAKQGKPVAVVVRKPEHGSGHAHAACPGWRRDITRARVQHATGVRGLTKAVACARLGSRVAMIGQVGTDGFGDTLRAGLMADGIDVSHVKQTSAAGTGVAMILVEDIGQNRIVLAARANGTLSSADIDTAGELIDGAALLVVQLEVPLDVVLHAMRRARAAGVCRSVTTNVEHRQSALPNEV